MTVSRDDLSAARARLLELSQNLQALSAGFALGAVYGGYAHPEETMAGDLRVMLAAALPPAEPLDHLSGEGSRESGE